MTCSVFNSDDSTSSSDDSRGSCLGSGANGQSHCLLFVLAATKMALFTPAECASAKQSFTIAFQSPRYTGKLIHMMGPPFPASKITGNPAALQVNHILLAGGHVSVAVRAYQPFFDFPWSRARFRVKAK